MTMILLTLKSEESIKAEKEAEEKKKEGKKCHIPFKLVQKLNLFIYYFSEIKKEEEKPQEPATAEIKPNKKILIEVKVEKKPLGVIVTGGKNNHVKVRPNSISTC